MNISEKGFISALLDTFKAASVTGAASIQTEVMAVIILLAIIEIALGAILNMDQDHLKVYAKKILKIGFYIWLVQNWISGLGLCRQVFESLQLIGIKAGSAGGVTGFTDPSYIGDRGVNLVKTILTSIFQFSNSGSAGVMGNLGIILVKILILFAIIFCVFYMAIQLFLTSVEFYILSTISLILVPFGINKHTAFLSEKAIGAIFSISIKMMVLQFILCLAVPMMQNWGTMLTGKEDPATLLYVLLGCAAMAFLTWQAPGLAASLLSGSPSLTAGNAIGAASGVASMAAGGASRLAAGAGAVFQATRATNGAQGAAQFAKNLGAAALQSTSFSQGRQNMKSLIQNASQISSNNTDQDLFKSPR